ncbi:hypothetical protein [Dulcicalothrix desertica]|nr:hypothetical protein [Dulcicalothrix desertica]
MKFGTSLKQLVVRVISFGWFATDVTDVTDELFVKNIDFVI